MKEEYYLKLRMGESKGRETFGYITCSLKEQTGFNEWKRVAFCNGGGYCMTGTVLGEWIQKEFQEELKKLNPEEFYGLFHRNEKAIVDGGCGDNSMHRILDALGYGLQVVEYKNNGDNRLWRVYKK